MEGSPALKLLASPLPIRLSNIAKSCNIVVILAAWHVFALCVFSFFGAYICIGLILLLCYFGGLDVYCSMIDYMNFVKFGKVLTFNKGEKRERERGEEKQIL